MGDSVNVEFTDVSPKIYKEIESELSKYQYGHFDGMQDLYEYSNSRDDIPQTKYLFIENRFSDETRQKAYEFLRVEYPANLKNKPELLKDAEELSFYDDAEDFVDLERRIGRKVRELLSASFQWEEKSAKFWDSLTSSSPKASAQIAGNTEIQKHTHTKKGFDMWIVILNGRVDKDAFNTLRDQAKNAGGWYSRKWGNTPGGFAFKTPEQAQSFAESLAGNKSGTATANDAENGERIAEKLEKLADGMQSKIDHKFGERRTNTPKQRQQAGRARQEGRDLERAQNGLRVLAELHRSGNVPETLKDVTTKARSEMLAQEKVDYSRGGYYAIGEALNRPYLESEEAHAFWALDGAEVSEEKQKAREIERLEMEIKNRTIAGYFPTPPPIVEKMLSYARIEKGERVLEPSAGNGAIADAARDAGATVECIECNHALIQVLQAKGHNVYHGDFIEHDFKGRQFDAVIMNPPFEKGQDVGHVMHAYDLVKSGGKLVAITSPAWQYRGTRPFSKFRDWLETVNYHAESLPEGSFKESGTNVNSVIIVIEK